MGLVKSQNTTILNSIVLMCEKFDAVLPQPHKPEYYITPVINWMTQEWKVIKKRITDNIVAAASVALLEAKKKSKIQEVIFTSERKNQMYQQLKRVMEKFKVDTRSHIGDALKVAKGDTIPKMGPDNRVQVMLSKAGLEEVIDGFEFQKNFVDDLEKSTRKRVSQLLKGRYGDVSSFRAQVNREFRIDRDGTLADFHAAVRGHAESMMAGRITPDSFQSKMQGSIHSFYGKMYREGKGAPLEAWEKEFVKKQAESQAPYLDNFGNYIKQKQALGKDLTSRITQRASLYAERGTALFESGHVTSFPDDALIDWVLQPAEHCRTCPILARNSPYTKTDLPGFPGEGKVTVPKVKKPKVVPPPKPKVAAPKPKVKKVVKPELLSTKDRKEISTAVGKATKNKTLEKGEILKREKIRGDLLKSSGISEKTIKNFREWEDEWTDASDSLGATKLSILNNRLNQRPDNWNLREKALEELKRNPYKPSDEEIRAAAVFRKFNQETVAQIRGKEFSTYRGVYGSYADDIKEIMKREKTSRLEIPAFSMNSESLDSDVAHFYGALGDRKGLVFEKKTKASEVWNSQYTSSIYGREIVTVPSLKTIIVSSYNAKKPKGTLW